jgi:hypothetical protein
MESAVYNEPPWRRPWSCLGFPAPGQMLNTQMLNTMNGGRMNGNSAQKIVPVLLSGGTGSRTTCWTSGT